MPYQVLMAVSVYFASRQNFVIKDVNIVHRGVR